MEQRIAGTLRIWAEPFTALPVPKLFNLRTDPFVAGRFLATFEEFPPAQKAPSFSIDQAVEKLQDSLASH